MMKKERRKKEETDGAAGLRVAKQTRGEIFHFLHTDRSIEVRAFAVYHGISKRKHRLWSFVWYLHEPALPTFCLLDGIFSIYLGVIRLLNDETEHFNQVTVSLIIKETWRTECQQVLLTDRSRNIKENSNCSLTVTVNVVVEVPAVQTRQGNGPT